MALVLAVKMGLFLKDFSKCLRQSIAQFPFVLETDFSFRGGLNRNTVRPKPFAASLAFKNHKIFHSLAFTIH